MRSCRCSASTPAELFTGNGVQAQLFPQSKYSPVGLDVLLKLPPSAERSFIVASALGRYVDRFGGRGQVYSQRAIAAVIIEAKHRRAVVKLLGTTAGGLRNDIRRWREWGVAHACSNSLLTIFVRVETACPVCKASLVGDAGPSEASSVGDGRLPTTSSVGDASERVSTLTDSRFFKGVVGLEEEASSAAGTQKRARSRKFEVFPELRALEESERRRRKAAG